MIVAADGQLYNVNAISGDMFKHIQAEHLYHIAKNSDDLPLCDACKFLMPIVLVLTTTTSPKSKEKVTPRLLT